MFDSGKVPFGTTRVATVGSAVAGVLSRVRETENHMLHIHNGIITQNQMIAEAEVITGSTFSRKDGDSDQLEKRAWGQVQDRSVNPMTWIVPFVGISI